MVSQAFGFSVPDLGSHLHFDILSIPAAPTSASVYMDAESRTCHFIRFVMLWGGTMSKLDGVCLCPLRCFKSSLTAAAAESGVGQTIKTGTVKTFLLLIWAAL